MESNINEKHYLRMLIKGESFILAAGKK